MSVLVPNHVHEAEVLRVHDGDTFTVMAKLDFFVRYQLDVRLRGYHAPELSEPGGLKALNVLAEHLPVGSKVTIVSFRDTAPRSTAEGERSLSRWVCDVWKEPNEGWGTLPGSVTMYMLANAPQGGM